MVRTQIQLTEEQAARLRERARAEGVSIAELVRRGVEAILGTGGGLPSQEERRQCAVEAAGRFASGRKDVSRRHDDYLSESFSR